MTTSQDSSHPEGVKSTGKPGDALAARNRKADAALQLRMSGANWAEIAQALGYPTPRQALASVERALQRQLSADTSKEQMRLLAGIRLERLLRGVWGKAIDTNNPEQMAAVSRGRELIADYRKLYGLDAPTELVVSTPTQTELEEWVLRMTATLVPDELEGDIWEADIVGEEPADEGLAG